MANVGSEDTDIPLVLKKVASRIDLAVLQFRHHFTKTPLGILHGKSAVIPPIRRSEGFGCWVIKWIFASNPAACIGRIQVLQPLLPLGEAEGAKGAVSHSTCWGGCLCFPQMGLSVRLTDCWKGPGFTKCLLGPKSSQSWEIGVATLRKAK